MSRMHRKMEEDAPDRLGSLVLVAALEPSFVFFFSFSFWVVPKVLSTYE